MTTLDIITPGRLVVGFDASDPEKRIWHIGECIGYCDRPTFIIDCGDRQIHWVADICRLATHDEEVAYWKGRAKAAEARVAAQSPGLTDKWRGCDCADQRDCTGACYPKASPNAGVPQRVAGAEQQSNEGGA